jgi:flagellar hook-basal body complex protein FliE
LPINNLDPATTCFTRPFTVSALLFSGGLMSFAINAATASSATAASSAGINFSGLVSPGTASSSVGQASAPTPFSDLLTEAVGQVSQLEDQARTTVDGLMAGSGVDVHQAMIATQKASMAFELALAVRNKAVQAYQQVIGMQF